MATSSGGDEVLRRMGWRERRSSEVGQGASAPPIGAGGDLRSIQYLRAVAALSVLAFHAAEQAGWRFGAGAAGVDVFFVISGFIMSLVGARPGLSPLAFLRRRAERIVPLYWLVTLGVAAAALIAPALFPRMVVTAPHLLQSLLFIPHAAPDGVTAPLIVPGWTLNFEAFFYLIFALSLPAPAWIRPWLLSAVLGLLVAVGPLGDRAAPLWATYTSPLLLEFLAGVWLGLAWRTGRLPSRRWGVAMMVLGLAMFVGVAALGLEVESARVVLWGAPAFLLVAGAVCVERSAGVGDHPWLRLVGDGSYSIYLVHGLAISAAVRLLALAGIDRGLALFLPAVAAALVAGVACYGLVEKTLMRIFHRRSRPAVETRAAVAGGDDDKVVVAAP
ncbi:MAG: putative acyltransferase [Caulobacter sp.]|nr:putative acyltransferase [Caulobacter sp.]